MSWWKRAHPVDHQRHQVQPGHDVENDRLAADDPESASAVLGVLRWGDQTGIPFEASTPTPPTPHGADIDTIPDHHNAPPVEIAGVPDTRRGLLIEWLAKRATT